MSFANKIGLTLFLALILFNQVFGLADKELAILITLATIFSILIQLPSKGES